jgi:hypothetical protein
MAGLDDNSAVEQIRRRDTQAFKADDNAGAPWRK